MLRKKLQYAPAVYACNPTYSEGGGKEDQGSKSDPGK
jgi:hypothetical protein